MACSISLFFKAAQADSAALPSRPPAKPKARRKGKKQRLGAEDYEQVLLVARRDKVSIIAAVRKRQSREKQTAGAARAEH